MFCHICCFVAKSLFYAIYAVLSRNLFCRYLRALAWGKLRQKFCLWRKKDKYQVCMRFSPSVSLLTIPHVAWSCRGKVTLFAFFSRMSFQMRPQTACMNQCKVVLAMNVQINSNFSKCDFPERIFKCLQIDILNNLQITLVACVRLFSGVSFQASP